MKKAMRILFLVSAIASLATMVTIFIISIYFLVFSSPGLTETIIKGLEDGSITSTFPGDNTEKAAAIQSMFLGLAIASLIHAGLCLINFLLSFIARVKDNKPLYIANIVIGFLSLIIINMVAGIFGLVIQKNESITSDENIEIEE